ncbi:MAG: cellulase family glycosylhydrolase [Bacteroidota bacterium]
MKKQLSSIYLLLALIFTSVASYSQPVQIWKKDKAQQWYAKQPWLVGCNYTPQTAINQLEMWQAISFDPATIDKELGWAESIGMNTLRVFLHDLLWEQDSTGFADRIDEFLTIAKKHKIKPMLVIFDSCWDPFPKLGKQHEPTPGVHNSGWVQSPGGPALQDAAQHARLETYVKGIVGRFKNDNRILAWDVWNEPDNTNGSSYGKQEPADKVDLVTKLLPEVFRWVKSANPSQPVTCGVWAGDWSTPDKLKPIEKIQIENSDVVSFHNYDASEEFEKRVKFLQVYDRPLLCTEYMARGNKSTFQGTMPVAKKYKVAVYNWGFVAGKTQTNMPWDSWQKPYVDREPAIWFHEIFYADGKPYKTEEVAFIKQITNAKAPVKKAPAKKASAKKVAQ